MADEPSLLTARGVQYSAGRQEILKGVNLTLTRGESVALVGRSGAGKSTFLSLCLGLMPPSEGSLTILGTDLGTASHRVIARMRRESVAMVFQHGELLPDLTPPENVAVAGLLSGLAATTSRLRATALLDALGVPIGEEPTATLSGGERQRTAFARALMNEPDLLLADEPTGSLDDTTKDAVAESLFALPRSHGCGLLLVTHDTSLAARADRVLTMHDGMIKMARA